MYLEWVDTPKEIFAYAANLKCPICKSAPKVDDESLSDNSGRYNSFISFVRCEEEFSILLTWQDPKIIEAGFPEIVFYFNDEKIHIKEEGPIEYLLTQIKVSNSDNEIIYEGNFPGIHFDFNKFVAEDFYNQVKMMMTFK